MAPEYQRLISLVRIAAMVTVASWLVAGGVFSTMNGLTVAAICACVYACLAVHVGRRAPESLVIVAAALVFMIAYTMQAVLFAQSEVRGSALADIINVRAIFSRIALGAGDGELRTALHVMLAGFVGILVSSLFFAAPGRSLGPPVPQRVVTNPMTIGYLALACTVFFGVLRKHFGLDSPTEAGLPMGLGALINISSAYLGPNLSFAALFFALQLGHVQKARRLALLALLLGLFNYVLFTSKISLIFPVLFLLASQFLLNRWVITLRVLLTLGAVFVTVYPFLNLYRSAVALGIAPGQMLDAVSKMYSSQQATHDATYGILQSALSAILGRFVGFDPLMILLQTSSFHGSVIDYLLYGNLDKTLTYDILGFSDPMGYSPGFLGRLFYISENYFFVLAGTALTVTAVALSASVLWRRAIRLRFIAPLLLTYCLVFFTDGIRFELFRSLTLSIVMAYALLRVVATTRALPLPRGGSDA